MLSRRHTDALAHKLDDKPDKAAAGAENNARAELIGGEALTPAQIEGKLVEVSIQAGGPGRPPRGNHGGNLMKLVRQEGVPRLSGARLLRDSACTPPECCC